jgi:hypothetical protein
MKSKICLALHLSIPVDQSDYHPACSIESQTPCKMHGIADEMNMPMQRRAEKPGHKQHIVA